MLANRRTDSQTVRHTTDADQNIPTHTMAGAKDNATLHVETKC